MPENKVDEYQILNDGVEREVLTHPSWDKGMVFATVDEARKYIRYLEGENVEI